MSPHSEEMLNRAEEDIGGLSVGGEWMWWQELMYETISALYGFESVTDSDYVIMSIYAVLRQSRPGRAGALTILRVDLMQGTKALIGIATRMRVRIDGWHIDDPLAGQHPHSRPRPLDDAGE